MRRMLPVGELLLLCWCGEGVQCSIRTAVSNGWDPGSVQRPLPAGVCEACCA